MNVTPDNQSAAVIRPPHMIHSLVNGFNTVANNIYLIILPVLLDLLLWFGPHLRIKALLLPGVQDLMKLMQQASSAEMRPVLDNFEALWRSFLEQYNVFSMLSTFPVGIPTLMAGQLPLKSPLGAAPIIEVSSLGQFFLAWVAFTLLGFALGCLYFAGVAQSCSRQAGQVDCGSSLPDELPTGVAKREPGHTIPPFRPGPLAWQLLQVIFLVGLLLVIALILLLPTVLLATLVGLINPILAQLVLLVVTFGSVWLLTPLVFSPHGIFLCGQSVFNAMLNSARVVRYILPGTGIFLLVLIVLSQGLNVLWNSPPATSWMALIGVFGHAFIMTGLLAASFIYYRSGLAYVQAIQKMAFKIG